MMRFRIFAAASHYSRRPPGDHAIDRLRKIGTRNWPQISRRACGPPFRPDFHCRILRRVALAQNSARQSTHEQALKLIAGHPAICLLN